MNIHISKQKQGSKKRNLAKEVYRNERLNDKYDIDYRSSDTHIMIKKRRVTMEKKIKEALERMNILKLHENVIRDLNATDPNERQLNKSEHLGMLYWLDDNEKQMIEDFEEKHKAFVYHVIYTPTAFGRLLSLLYVSNEEDEWETDREDLSNNYAFSYVINLNEPAFSEFGSIEIEPKNGGVVRTR